MHVKFFIKYSLFLLITQLSLPLFTVRESIFQKKRQDEEALMRHPQSNQSNEDLPVERRNASVATTTDLLWTQPGLAMPEHKKHLRDKWSLHSKERDSHEGPDIRR